MKSVSRILFVLVLAAAPAFSQTDQDHKHAADAPDRKAVQGFGGYLIVVENPQGFVKEWIKPESPTIKPARDVTRGKTIGAFVLFAGCKQDPKGMCNSEVDYTIYKPDGEIFAERSAEPLWKEQAPPASNTQLGRAIIAFKLGKENASGEYRVKAKVSDFNADISFELETKFRLK